MGSKPWDQKCGGTKSKQAQILDLNIQYIYICLFIFF